jgi:hypothetical protein
MCYRERVRRVKGRVDCAIVGPDAVRCMERGTLRRIVACIGDSPSAAVELLLAT